MMTFGSTFEANTKSNKIIETKSLIDILQFPYCLQKLVDRDLLISQLTHQYMER